MKRSSSGPHRRHRRRRHRSNPGLFMANPRRRRRRHRTTAMVVHTGPRRRRRRRLGNPRHHRMHRRRRRSNPGRLRLGNWGHMARMLLWGGAGIVVARVGGYLYTKYAADTVKGTGGESWRATLSEIARLFAMGASVVLVDEVLKRARIMRPEDHHAFRLAGLGETGRQAVALGVKELKPDINADAYGLSGPQYVAYAVAPNGDTYGQASDGKWYLAAAAMGDLIESSEFGDLIESSEFGDLVDEAQFDEGNEDAA